jgi:hypothetical protein
MRLSRVAGPLLALAVPLGTIVGPAATPASAATTHVVTSHDQWGDVRSTATKRLTLREKRSIDMGRVTVDRVDRTARVTIRVRKVIRVPKFDQMFFITLTERRDAPGGQWMTNAGFTTKDRGSYAAYSSMNGNQWDNCRLAVDVRPVKRELVATIPWRCAAEGPVKVAVYSYTGHFETDQRPYSADRHTITGRHTILPN